MTGGKSRKRQLCRACGLESDNEIHSGEGHSFALEMPQYLTTGMLKARGYSESEMRELGQPYTAKPNPRTGRIESLFPSERVLEKEKDEAFKKRLEANQEKTKDKSGK